MNRVHSDMMKIRSSNIDSKGSQYKGELSNMQDILNDSGAS